MNHCTEAPCSCAACRREIRDRITAVFRRERRWLGYWTVYALGHLTRFRHEVYGQVFADLVWRGLIVRIHDPAAPFTVYMLSSLIPAPKKRARKQGKRGTA